MEIFGLEKLQFRVTDILQIRVSWILQMLKIGLFGQKLDF